MTSELDRSAAEWNKRQKKEQSRGKLLRNLILAASVIVALGARFTGFVQT